MLKGCLNCNSGRLSLANMLNSLELVGQAVEVGTHRGGFAAPFLSLWRGKMLYCVDPWANPPGYEDQATYLEHSRGKDRQGDYDACIQTMRKIDPHGCRYTLMRTISLQAVNNFLDGQLDFVYVDGDHTRPNVDNDLEAWWPKVRQGGLLAGHDFVCPMEVDGGWGRFIQPAVMEFAARHSVDVWVVAEPTSTDSEPNLFPWSYYCVKP